MQLILKVFAIIFSGLFFIQNSKSQQIYNKVKGAATERGDGPSSSGRGCHSCHRCGNTHEK